MQNSITLKRISIVLVILTALSCDQNVPQLSQPKPLKDGWEISSPEQEKMNMALLTQAVEKNRQHENVDAFVIVRNGRLIVDEYYNGYSFEKRHKVWSITKSITSAVTGIAIEKKFINSENDSFYKYMGVYTEEVPANKKSITIKHLLAMTSGIEWVELGGPNSAGYLVAFSPDWVTFVLEQPMQERPGASFNYSSGNYMLLAPILKNSTGEQADVFARKYLFSPLGINDYEWVKCSEFWEKTEGGELPSVSKPDPPIQFAKRFRDYPSMGSGLKMLPRDIAKIGQLYLNRGKWDGKQIVDADWIEESTREQFGNNEYGLGWRLTSFDSKAGKIDCYYATGFGEQCMYIFPEYNLVVVFTQQNYRTMEEGREHTQDILQNYILPAIQ